MPKSRKFGKNSLSEASEPVPIHVTDLVQDFKPVTLAALDDAGEPVVFVQRSSIEECVAADGSIHRVPRTRWQRSTWHGVPEPDYKVCQKALWCLRTVEGLSREESHQIAFSGRYRAFQRLFWKPEPDQREEDFERFWQMAGNTAAKKKVNPEQFVSFAPDRRKVMLAILLNPGITMRGIYREAPLSGRYAKGRIDAAVKHLLEVGAIYRTPEIPVNGYPVRHHVRGS